MKKQKISRDKIVIHEPLWNVESDHTQFPILFNWYNYNKTSEDAKKYFIQHLKDTNEPVENVNKISRYDDIPLSNAIGWLCRIKKNCGEIVSTKYDYRIIDEKNKILDFINVQDSKIQTANVIKKSTRPSVQEHINNQLCEYLGEIAFRVDQYIISEGKNTFDCYEWLKSNSIKHQQAKNIAEYISKTLLSELNEALSGECEQLTEAYSFLTKSKLKKFIQFVSDIVENCVRWSDVARQISLNNRVPRIKKPKSPLKQVAKLKYLREHDNLKSVPATSIVGAKTLLVYNVKTRVLGMYVCNNAHGFSVKGSSILNFESSESLSKTLRKPDEIIPKVIAGGKVAIRKTIEDLTTKEKKLNGRINVDTILLRAF